MEENVEVKVKSKSIVISESTHKKLVDIKKELKIKSQDMLLNKLADEYINNRK